MSHNLLHNVNFLQTFLCPLAYLFHLVLQAIYHADEQLFSANPQLKNTPVLIHFISSQASYNKLYEFGSIGEYNII